MTYTTPRIQVLIINIDSSIELREVDQARDSLKGVVGGDFEEYYPHEDAVFLTEASAYLPNTLASALRDELTRVDQPLLGRVVVAGGVDDALDLESVHIGVVELAQRLARERAELAN